MVKNESFTGYSWTKFDQLPSTMQIWSISINDPDADSLFGSITVSDQTSSINGESGIFNIYLNNLTSGSFTVYVEVTDGTSLVEEWYQFSIDKKQTNNESVSDDVPGFDIMLLLVASLGFIFIKHKKKEK